jgi:hypothetical protein
VPVAVPKAPALPAAPVVSTPSVKVRAGAPASSGAGAASKAHSSSAATGGRSSSASVPGGGSGSGYGSGYSTPAPAPGALHGFARLDARERALIAAVKGLQGCLTSLPDRLRLVLQLRTGIGVGRPYSRVAVAGYLRMKPEQVSRLERTALRLLRRTAHTQSCVGAPPSLAGLLAPGAGGPAAGGPAAAGAVKAARYAKAPALSGLGVKPTSPSGESALGLSPSPAARNVLLAVGLVLSGMLLIGVLFAEELGLGPHFRRWRHRWIRRPPR